MASQWSIQDQNRFPALLGHSGTAGTAETVRITANQTGELSVSLSNGGTLVDVRDSRLKIDIADSYGFEVENTPTGELRTIIPSRLVGASFSGTIIDPTFWSQTLNNGGTMTQVGGDLNLSTGTSSNGEAIIQSVRSARYVGGSPNRYRGVIQLDDLGEVNNSRKWGMFNGTDGAYFELDGTILYAVTLKSGTATRVSSSNWNVNKTLPTITNANTYEIYITNSNVYFIIGNVMKHIVTASSTTWSNSLALPLRVSTTNTGISNEHTIQVRVMTIYRLGNLSTQPTHIYQSGVGTVTCKSGPGNLHGLVVSNVSNSSNVTLYDSIGTSSSVIWSSGGMGALTQPFSIEMHDIPFSSGLTLSISGATSNILAIFE